jgi:hypothetical protein
MKIRLNRAFRSMRGAVDDFVYRRLDGQTIVGGRPDPSTAPPTEPQLRQRNRFKDGNAYAKLVFADPVRKAVYEAAAKAAGVSTAFALALGDYLNPPEVTEVDITGYAGRVGDLIKVRAQDDFGVLGVQVTLRDEAGALIEQGPAVPAGAVWVYTAQTVAPLDRTVRIEAEASDRAGNQRTLSEGWHA